MLSMKHDLFKEGSAKTSRSLRQTMHTTPSCFVEEAFFQRSMFESLMDNPKASMYPFSRYLDLKRVPI